jgi:hypothetical protein
MQRRIIMNYQNFCERIKETVGSLLGEDYNVRLVKTEKLNGLILTSLVILKKEDNIAPNIYLEPYYSEFQINRKIELIADSIISLYHSANKRTELASIPITDYLTIKDQLFCKLINYAKNRSLLNGIPHIRYLDLAVIFCIMVKMDGEGLASFTVKNELMEQWGVTIDNLYEKAIENTPLLFIPSVQPMEDIIRGIISDHYPSGEYIGGMDEFLPELLTQQDLSGKNTPMYVAGNKYGLGGAAYLLQKDELHRLSCKLNSNLYILPSSVHELIIIPYTDSISKDNLLTMVQDVNATQVAPDEFLSDNVYLYTQEEDAILPLF